MKRKFVFIGLNKYGIPGNDLRGCLNDIKDWQLLLTTTYGLELSEQKTLLDSNATTDNIKNVIKWLTTDVGPDDVISLFYSGHGSQMPSNDPDEIDGKNEILCPYDIDFKSKVISDKFLVSCFKDVPAEAMSLIVLDCCHSGDALRDFGLPLIESTSKFLTPPQELWSDLPSISMMKDIRIGGRYSKQKGVLMSGCASDQTSADAFINGRNCGAFSYFMMSALKQNPYLTYKELMTIVDVNIAKAGYTQKPELDCNELMADLPFLGGPVAI